MGMFYHPTEAGGNRRVLLKLPRRTYQSKKVAFTQSGGNAAYSRNRNTMSQFDTPGFARDAPSEKIFQDAKGKVQLAGYINNPLVNVAQLVAIPSNMGTNAFAGTAGAVRNLISNAGPVLPFATVTEPMGEYGDTQTGLYRYNKRLDPRDPLSAAFSRALYDKDSALAAQVRVQQMREYDDAVIARSNQLQDGVQDALKSAQKRARKDFRTKNGGKDDGPDGGDDDDNYGDDKYKSDKRRREEMADNKIIDLRSTAKNQTFGAGINKEVLSSQAGRQGSLFHAPLTSLGFHKAVQEARPGFIYQKLPVEWAKFSTQKRAGRNGPWVGEGLSGIAPLVELQRSELYERAGLQEKSTRLQAPAAPGVAKQQTSLSDVLKRQQNRMNMTNQLQQRQRHAASASASAADIDARANQSASSGAAAKSGSKRPKTKEDYEMEEMDEWYRLSNTRSALTSLQERRLRILQTKYGTL